MTYAGDLTPREAWELLERDPDAVLVDVRSEAEWTFVGVPDLTALGKQALGVSWSSWPGGERHPDFVGELRRAGVGDGPVVFLCRSGARSQAAAAAATDAGLEPAYNVAEGFEGHLDDHGHRGESGWRARGLPWRQS